MSKKAGGKWYHQLKWAAVIAVLALVAAYGIGSRSLDTGSWQQYFMTLGLLILGVNRTVHMTKYLFHRSFRKA